MTTNLTDPALVPDEELDQMIWKLERDGMTPKMLSLMRELRAVRKAKSDGRDQFEEWFKFHHGEEGTIVTLNRANGGANYADPHVDLAWIAWNDSRAALYQSAPLTSIKPASTLDSLPKNGEMGTSNSPVTPDGWRLVPVEPTVDMRKAFHKANDEADSFVSPDHQWSAMLAAAPQEVK
ncbi:hypothetical protein AB4K05_11750 [Kluyvera sp. STS39-E]|uniref:hypothetical protein n=1 Tax=Kluyvera sp. STS39-E TaxID=3234748 RepID=UPI0034C5E72A